MIRLFVFLGLWASAGFSQELPEIERVESPTPAFQRMRQVEAETVRLLNAGDRDALEKLAETLRDNRERLDGGTWILARFYDKLSDLPADPEAAAERVKFFERWAAEHPESRTAPVALAEALTAYAWRARGSGWASSVTEEGWRLMAERLERAWEVLDGAQGTRCPGWYAAAQDVALGQSWDRARYFELVDEALRNEPTYGTYYTKACYWMLPRWHGEPGEFAGWLAEKADEAPEAERDWKYAFLVWMAERMPVSGEIIFNEENLDWERTKRGFRQWMDALPENRMVQFQFLRLALLANDRETARAQFDVLGGAYFPPMWKDEAQFEAARAFAYADGGNPLLKKTPSGRRSLSPEFLQTVESAVAWTVRATGGFLAGLALFILALQRLRPWSGAAAWVGAIVAALPFGTMGTVVPALLLWADLRRRGESGPPPVAPAPGWWILLGLLVLSAIYLGLQFGSSLLVAIPFGMANPQQDPADFVVLIAQDGRLFSMAGSAGWLTLLVLLIFCGSGQGFAGRLAWVRPPALAAFLWIVGGFILVAGLGLLTKPYLDERSREGLALFSLGLESPIPVFLAVVILAPFVEELVFRGYAWTGLAARWGAPAASVITAVVFTALHVQYGWVALSVIFVFGLLLAAARWHTGSVIPCIVLHLLNNLAHMVNQAMGEPF